MEKALKFPKSCGRIIFTFHITSESEALAEKNRIKAQQSGFDSERKNAGADMQTVGKAFGYAQRRNGASVF